MVKLMLVILSVIGAMFVMTHYVPSSWAHGFHVNGKFVPIGACILAGIAILGFRLKGK